MTTSHSLSVETLGRITVLQSMVTLMPNKISMLDFVCQGLKDVTGVKSLAYRLFDGSTYPPNDSVRSAETMRVFPIKYNAVTYAELNFEIAESEDFDPYIPFLQNFVNMLGVVFEGQSQRKLNETLLEELEQRVAERTSELQEKTEDLRITLNSIGDAVISTDIYGFVTKMNPVAEKLTGWKIVDGIGRNLTDVFQIVNVATSQPALNPVKRVLATGEIVGLANHTSLIAKDGTRYQIADSAAPIRDIDGNICGVVLVFRDVSDEYRIAEALKSSEERFLLAMKASHDGLFDWNLETNDIYYSPAWKKMLGYEDHELPNDFSVWENATEPEDVKKSWELQRKLISKQIYRFVFEFKMKHKDGHWVDILSRAEAFFNDSGKAVRIVGTHVDITERKKAEEALLESKERFRALFSSVSDPVLVADRDTGILMECNEAAERYFGRSREQLIGLSQRELHPPEALPVKGVTEDFKRQVTHPGGLENIRLLAAGGEVRCVEVSASSFEIGESRLILGVFRDVTERKQAEEALRRYEWIIEKETPWVDTKDSGFESAYGDVTEYNRKRLILDGVKKENLEQMAVDVMALLDTSLAVYEANGDYAYGIFKSSWCQSLDSAAFKLCGTNDVKKALTCGKWLCHDNCWNDSAKAAIESGNPTDIECVGGIRLYAVPVFVRNEIIGVVNIGYGNPPEDNETLTKLSKKFNISFDLLRAKANAYKARPGFIVELGKKRCQHMARMIGEIIENKQAELEKEKLQAQLTQAQKIEAVGQLAGGVAHDFNNMLGVIIGYSEMILEQVDSSQQFHSELAEIQKAARRSADLTRQLLTFARKQTVAPKVLDLNQTIEGMLKMLRRLIGENIGLIWMPGAGLWPIYMDPSQIDQILANLCVNGRDAITGVGKLTVETKNVSFDKEYCATHAGSLQGDYVRIAVSDTGSGMDKETLAHIFEPFFTTKGVGEGTGLGLATVYGAVKQNSGFINAYSEPGQGTTFTIYIPRHVETTTETQTTASTDPVLRGDEIVMLVEDEPTLLQMSKTMLERLGYTVLTAGAPSEAIRLAGEYSGQIHLLATDVIMPEMNGRELSARLLESRPEMKCLFMSGYTANIIANQGVLKKGVPFIQKPFSKNELAAKVREAMEI